MDLQTSYYIIAITTATLGVLLVGVWRVAAWHTKSNALEHDVLKAKETLVDHDRRIQSIEDVPAIKVALNGGYHGRGN